MVNIRSLTLKTKNLAAQRDFYLNTLGFKWHGVTSDAFTVCIGSSLFTFVQDDHFTGLYHVAFDIPRNLVAQARGWLQGRVPLLADEHGETLFLPSERWNTTNQYFDDAGGNILEFIARHDLPHESTRTFDAGSVLHISELGVVMLDVARAVQSMGQRFSLHPFNGQSDTFTAVGGHDGMLIVVREGRGWFPVGRPAVSAPFTLEFVGPDGTQYTLTDTTCG